MLTNNVDDDDYVRICSIIFEKFWRRRKEGLEKKI